MKTKIVLLIALTFSVLMASGQGTSGSKSNFKFRFLDETTGVRVVPRHVEISRRGDQKIGYYISNEQVAGNGTASVAVPDGVYDITVSANGYEIMRTYFEVMNQTLDVNFYLVPITRPPEISPKYLRAHHQSDAVLIVGFVVDDFTGVPLSNVKIYSGDKIVKTNTNAEGFFQLALPLASGKNMLENRNRMFFVMDSYTTEVRQKFDMWPDGDAIFRIRMKKGKGINKVDVVQKREANRVILNRKNSQAK